MREAKGAFEPHGSRFAIVAAQFNDVVVSKLVDGAAACFRAHGVPDDDLFVAWVPGAFEIPFMAKQLAVTGAYDAVVCLGAVVRGETAHFDFVAGECARGIQQVGLETGVPCSFGVLTTETMAQAFDRSGGKHGNKGWDAAMAAMQMTSLLTQLPKED
jgi:6,7-dimethyl-8-ribityllumazine synthase